MPGRRKDQVAGGQRRARSTVPLASDRGDAVPVACHSSFSISFRPACLVLAGHTHSRHCASAGSSTHSPPDLLHFSVNYPSEAEDFEFPELARPCATLRCNRFLYNIAGVRYRYSPYTNLPVEGGRCELRTRDDPIAAAPMVARSAASVQVDQAKPEHAHVQKEERNAQEP